MAPSTLHATTAHDADSSHSDASTTTATSDSLREPDQAVSGVLDRSASSHADGAGTSHLLNHPALYRAPNHAVRTIALTRAQQNYGNRFAQRVVSNSEGHGQPAGTIRRACACGGTCSACSAQSAATSPQISSTHPSVIQTQPLSTESHHMPRGVSADVVPRESQGQPLDTSVQQFMQGRFGADFADVRIHTDRSAAESPQCLGPKPTRSDRISTSPMATMRLTLRTANDCSHTNSHIRFSKAK